MTFFRIAAMAVIGAGSVVSATASLAAPGAGSAGGTSARAGAAASNSVARGGSRGVGRGGAGGFGRGFGLGLGRDFGAGFRGGYGGGFGDTVGFSGSRARFGHDFSGHRGRGWEGDRDGGRRRGDERGGYEDEGSYYVEGLGSGYGDTRDSDFFAPYSGPRTLVGQGRVVYGYDRGYPYDHFDNPGASRRISRAASAGAPRCDIVSTRDSNLGRQVPVRVCRQ